MRSDYQIIIAPAADSVDKLRRIDVARVLLNCHANFPASFTDFVGWLGRVRPDLEARIASDIAALTEDGEMKL